MCCLHCQHQIDFELTLNPKSETSDGEHSACYFELRVQSLPMEPDTKSKSETSFDQSSQSSVPSSRTGSISAMPQPSKNVFSVPPETVRCNPTLFDEPSEKPVPKSNAVEPKSSSKLRNLMLSSSAAGLPEPSKDSVHPSGTESKPTVPSPSKNSISVPPEGVKSNPSLFDEPSEMSKSKSKSSMIKPSKNLDHSAGTTSNNFDKTGEEPGSPAKKDLKSVESSNNTKLPATTVGSAAQPDSSYDGDSPSVSKQEEHSSSAGVESTAGLQKNASG